MIRASHDGCAGPTRELDGASAWNCHQASSQCRFDAVEPRLSDTYREAFNEQLDHGADGV